MNKQIKKLVTWVTRGNRKYKYAIIYARRAENQQEMEMNTMFSRLYSEQISRATKRGIQAKRLRRMGLKTN